MKEEKEVRRLFAPSDSQEIHPREGGEGNGKRVMTSWASPASTTAYESVQRKTRLRRLHVNMHGEQVVRQQ